MFKPFSREEGVLDQKPFLDYEVQFNLFHRIIEGREVIALRTEDKNAIVLQNPGFAMWLWINETLEESKVKDIINDLCNKLKEDKLRAISGRTKFVKYFAEQYSKMLGVSYELGLGMEAYECPKIIKPKGVQGKLIKAELKHTDVVADFCVGFVYWCFGVTVTKESQIPAAREMIESGNLFLWEVNGEICSMANIAHRSKRHARLNNVYTPPEQRKKGYASAIVAELCSKVNDEGLIPMLYADVKNPDSNKVYKGVGFKERGRIARFDFK